MKHIIQKYYAAIEEENIDPDTITKDMDKVLQLFFFSGFKAYRDLTVESIDQMDDNEAMAFVIELDEELDAFWDKKSGFSL